MSLKKYAKKLELPMQIQITAVSDGHQFLVETSSAMNPEVQVIIHNEVLSYAQAIRERERKAKKGDRQLTKKELSNVLSTIAYCQMIISTQAPILYKDLKMETEKLIADREKEKPSDIEVVRR